MNVVNVAQDTRSLCLAFDPVRSEKGIGIRHAVWMLDQVIDGYVAYEKAHRWLGYAQAIVVVEGGATLAQLKDINKP